MSKNSLFSIPFHWQRFLMCIRMHGYTFEMYLISTFLFLFILQTIQNTWQKQITLTIFCFNLSNNQKLDATHNFVESFELKLILSTLLYSKIFQVYLSWRRRRRSIHLTYENSSLNKTLRAKHTAFFWLLVHFIIRLTTASTFTDHENFLLRGFYPNGFSYSKYKFQHLPRRNRSK